MRWVLNEVSSQAKSLDKSSVVHIDNYSDNYSETAVYDKYKDTVINHTNDLHRNEIDKYNELAFENSNNGHSELSEPDLKSFKAIDDEEYPTAMKQKSSRNYRSNRSGFEDEEDSEVTQVFIKSTKAEDEVKDTEENQPGNDFFNDFDNKMHSPINPFDNMQDTMDINDKVVHLSTINTNENMAHDEDQYDFENEEIDNNKEEIKNNVVQALEDMEESGSIVEVISHKDGHAKTEDEANSETKRNLFSGRDSMLRDIISNTPRSFQENIEKEETTNLNYFHEEQKDNNSDAATKKRAEVSNLIGTMTPVSSTSSQFFQKNSSFQRFSLLQFNTMMENKDFGVPIELSEKAVRYREKTENKIINKMIQSQKYSPRIINDRRVQLETWVSNE